MAQTANKRASPFSTDSTSKQLRLTESDDLPGPDGGASRNGIPWTAAETPKRTSRSDGDSLAPAQSPVKGPTSEAKCTQSSEPSKAAEQAICKGGSVMERLRERIRAREAAAAITPSSDCKASVSALLEAARGPSSVNALLQAASEPVEKKEQKQKQKVPPSLTEKEHAHLGLLLGSRVTDDLVSAETGTTPAPSVTLRLWKHDTRNDNYANDDNDDKDEYRENDDKDEYRELLAFNAAHNAEDPSGAGFVIGANVITEKQIYFIEFERQKIGYVMVVPSFVHRIMPDRRQLELFTSKAEETMPRILDLPAKLPLVERIYVKPEFRKQGNATKALASLGAELSLQALIIHCPVPAIQKAMKQALSMDMAAVRADAEGKPLVLYMSGIEPPTC